MARHQVCSALVASLLCVTLACSGKKQSESGSAASSQPSAPLPSALMDGQKDLVNACNYLSAEDAQAIEGAPMKRSSIPKNQNVCRYDEVTPKPGSLGPAILSLTINKSNSDADQNRAWAMLKEIRHLAPGEKNVAVLSGIGDEAYFTGNTEKGKVGVASVVARRGKYNLAVDSMVLEYRASPQAMKSIAKRIADQLP